MAVLVTGCGEKEAADAATKGKSAGAPAAGAGAPGGGGGRGGRGGGAGGQKQPVEVTAIARRDLTETLRVVGSLAPNETASIRPEMQGLIRAIEFTEGQRVKKGEILVRIEDSELRAQFAQSEARFELAKQNLTRAQALRQTLSNTEADVDRARSEHSAAQADLELLKVRLARTEVRAPFDGVVGARTLSNGDYVNTQTVLTTINDLSKLKVEFQVPEAALGKIKAGTPFTVKSTALNTGTTAGEVYFVNSVIDRATRSSEVKGYVTDANTPLRAGMFAEVEIVLDVRKGALTVPEGAILVDQRGPQIITVGDQGAEKVAVIVPVKLGLRARGLVEVAAVNGQLNENQQVVAAGVGSLALFSGARLEPRPLRAEFQIKETN